MFLLSQEGDNELFQFHLLYNHIAQLVDLLTAECIRDNKVDHLPVIHTCWECLMEPKVTSNLIELNLLVLELGIQ